MTKAGKVKTMIEVTAARNRFLNLYHMHVVSLEKIVSLEKVACAINKRRTVKSIWVEPMIL